jgi:hypothetical protein
VIVTTGLLRSAVQEKADGDEATVYFEKPSTLEEFMKLGSIVRQVLEQRADDSTDPAA